MSSVGSSDSSGSSNSAAEVARKNREAATSSTQSNNESELVKKHQREIRRLTEDHYNEMEGLKKAFNDKLNEMRKSSHDTVSEHDHKYQKEIEDLRGLYRKQLQDQADEANRRETTIVKAKDTDSTNMQKRNEERLGQVRETFQQNLTEQEKLNNQAFEEAKNQQATAIQKNRENLTRHYETEGQAMQENQQARYSDLQNTYKDFRQNTNSRIKDQELRHMQGQQRASKQLMQTVQNERQAAADQEANLRDGFKDGLRHARESFLEAGQKQRADVDAARESFRDTVTGRIDGQVARLEDENEELRVGSDQERVKTKAQQQREMANLSEAYQKNIDNYKEQRDRAVSIGSERMHKSVEAVRKELGEQMTQNARFYKIKEDELNHVNRGAVTNLRGEYEGRVEQSRDNMENRVKNLLDTRAQEQEREAQMQAENLQASQRGHQDDVRTIRFKMEDEKKIVVANLLDRLQKQEVKHNENMTVVVNKYEKQVQALKDQLLREKKTNEENLRRTTEEMQRAFKLSMDQVEMQTRDKLRMVDNKHNEELKMMNKRNDEKIDQVIAQVKKT